MKKILLLFVPVILLFLSCKNTADEEAPTYITNKIAFTWKGSCTSAPNTPEIGWAYYNTTKKASYYWDGSSWCLMVQDGIDGTDGIGIVWKGELEAAPKNPQTNWAYYNRTDGNSYIWNGSKWNYLAKSGRDADSGILLWLGSFDSHPENPKDGSAYYNSKDGISYIYSNGNWQILSKDGKNGMDGTNGIDGVSITWKGAYPISPSNPSLNCAYYNTSEQKSYIWDGSKWNVIAESIGGDTNVVVAISWLGTFETAPLNPVLGQAYYNSEIGASYIYDGTVWQQISKDGADGKNGENGKDGSDGKDGQSGQEETSSDVVGYLINWKGSKASAPANPIAGWAYYDTTEKKSYIYDGLNWQIMAQDGVDGTNGTAAGAAANDWCYLYVLLNVDGISYTQYNTQSFDEVDFGTVGLQSTIKATTFYLMLQSSTKKTFNLTGSPAIQISGLDADSFVITQPSITEVQSGSYITDATIAFCPTSLGEKTATITIPNNSPDYPDFSFTVKGTGSYWPKTFDGGEGDGDDKITYALHDSQGNLYFMGYGFELVNHHSGYDWWIKKFTSEGVEITNGWNKKIDHADDYSYSTPKDSELITNAIIDSNDNLIVASSTNTIKFSGNGTQIWEAPYGGTLYCDFSNDIYIVSSSTTTKISASGMVLYTLQVSGKLNFDNNGDFVINNDDTVWYYSSDGMEKWEKVFGDFKTPMYAYEIEGYIGKNSIEYYYVPITSGDKYLIGFNGSSYGDGSKTLSSNRISATYENTQTSIFSHSDMRASTSTEAFTASYTDNAIIKVAGWSSSYTGTYGLLVMNNITSGSEISSSSWKTANISSKGAKVTDTISVERGHYYVFSLDDSSHSGGNYSFNAELSAKWAVSGNSIFSTENDLWSRTKLLYATQDGDIIITVQGYSSSTTGTCAYAVEELQPVSEIRLLKPMTVNDVAFDSSNNMYAVGSQNCAVDSYSKSDARIKKYNSAGIEITSGWNKTFDWGHCDDEEATDVFFDGSKLIVFGNGNDLINGASKSDSWVKYFTTNGTEIESYEFENPISKIVDFDSSHYSLDVGKFDSNYYHYLYVYDNSFNLQTKYNIGNNGNMIVSDPVFVHNIDGNFYVAGYGSNLVTSASSSDWYILKY